MPPIDSERKVSGSRVIILLCVTTPIKLDVERGGKVGERNSRGVVER